MRLRFGVPLPDRAAALLTGVYGAGKTTLIAEIATTLEERGEPFGAIDLDWLGWFDVGWDDREGFAVAADNLRHVSSNYFAAGARRLVIAQSIEHSVAARRDPVSRQSATAGRAHRSRHECDRAAFGS